MSLPQLQFPPFETEPVNVQRKYELPSETRFCKRCVTSNQRPGITLDDESICSACRYDDFKKKEIDWEQRAKQMASICDRHRREDGRFDVIVPCSGGKDSGYVAHLLKTEYGMNPLTVTWAPQWYTDVGVKNLNSVIHAGINNICFTPDGQVHRLLTRLSMVHLGDPFQPFLYGVKNLPITLSAMHNIPLIMYGENSDVEYGGDMSNPSRAKRDTAANLAKHHFSGMRPEDWTKYGINANDLLIYRGPARERIEHTGVECHWMGDYLEWVPQEVYGYASEHLGFQPNPDGRSEGTYSKYASLDDRIDAYHYYMDFIKFGIGRCTSDASREIRDGLISREEGVNLVRQFDAEVPHRYHAEFLEYTGLTQEEFDTVIDHWRSDHLWEKSNGAWVLKQSVWQEDTSGSSANYLKVA